MKLKFTKYQLSIFALAALLSGCSIVHRIEYFFKKNVTKDDPAAVSRGRNLYLNNCAECHSPDARGGVSFPIVIPDLIEIARGHSDNSIAYKIASGHVYRMPDFDRYLSEQDIWDITNYLKTL